MMLDCKSCWGSLEFDNVCDERKDSRPAKVSICICCSSMSEHLNNCFWWIECEHMWCTMAYVCIFFMKHAGFWYLKFPESFLALLSTANRPMFCRKPSRLKGNWDMFSMVISSYIFLNQTWTKCEWGKWFVTRGLHAECDKNLPNTLSLILMIQCKVQSWNSWKVWKTDTRMLHVSALLRHVWTVIQLFIPCCIGLRKPHPRPRSQPQKP